MYVNQLGEKDPEVITDDIMHQNAVNRRVLKIYNKKDFKSFNKEIAVLNAIKNVKFKTAGPI